MLNPGGVATLLWSPDGRFIAAGLINSWVYILDAATGLTEDAVCLHEASVVSLAWSTDSKVIFTGGADDRIIGYDLQSRRTAYQFLHRGIVSGLSVSPSGALIASASYDRMISVRDLREAGSTTYLEGHTDAATAVAFSCDGKLLASRARNATRLWRVTDWQLIHESEVRDLQSQYAALAFHPQEPILAISDPRKVILWRLDEAVLLPLLVAENSESYSNAKVVLVGDTGVGKSGLGLVLSGEPWTQTDSTHGRRIWQFDRQIDDGSREVRREVFLWDLAGQPDYRLIHQLQLTEVAVALVVFDSRSPTDPFAGVRHWIRALRQAERVQGDSVPCAYKFLVAARADVGRIGVSAGRIEQLRDELGIDSYFEVSAKEGWGVPELAQAIRDAIDWSSLPKVKSTKLFQTIKEYLVAEKETGRVLSNSDDLYRGLLLKQPELEEQDLRAQFDTCVGRMESRGLVQRLSFGKLVLLQPELQDIYASAMANAVKDEPDGLGSLSEARALSGDFRIPSVGRLADAEQEKLLLISTVEDLLRHEIALREQGDDGPYLVFPSQLTRENPDLPDPEGKSIIFTFEGPVLNVYATLVVRLSYSGLFKKEELWKNAATFRASVGGTCGMYLCEVEDGRGELTLFFDRMASEETRFHFEEYVHTHLNRRALPNTIHRRRIHVCTGCDTPISDLAAQKRRERGFDWILCNVCETRISLLDREERLTAPDESRVAEMDSKANARRDLVVATATLEGKVATRDFDVFLCHNSKDKAEVKRVGEMLKERGILPWLDEWELRPGLPWQPELEKQIENIRSAAVFVGSEGMGPWQKMEIDALLREFVDRGVPVIPVLLPTAPKRPPLPVFLRGMMWVDFRRTEPDPLRALVWGITGERPDSSFGSAKTD